MEKLERFGLGLVNILLGALVLWIGQMTFHHAGLLASSDQKFAGMEERFNTLLTQYEGLRGRIDQVQSDADERTRLEFTREDAEKLISQIRDIDEFAEKLERRILERLAALQIKIVTLETHGRDAQEAAALRYEVAQLRHALQAPVVQSEPPLDQPEKLPQEPRRITVATATAPHYLPPVEAQR